MPVMLAQPSGRSSEIVIFLAIVTVFLHTLCYIIFLLNEYALD